jgi:hypothetical protein
VWRAGVIAVLLVACAGPTADPASVSLYQTRSDTPLDKVEIQVTNTGPDPITVQRAELRSPRLSDSAAWEEDVEVAPGAAVDLKVVLPAPRCDVDAGVTDEVVLTVDGRTVTRAAPDRLGQVGAYVRQRCFEQAVAQAAVIRVDAVTRRGISVFVDAGDARVGPLGTTILFAPVDRLALASRPGDAGVREVALAPNRCDAHALGEDKQGTYFGVEVTLPDGRSGTYTFGVDTAQRAQLYRLYARDCGLS